MTEKEPSPTKSDSTNSSILDPPGYIKPALQDLLLTDITPEELLNIAETLGVKYLGSASFPGVFPVDGSFKGMNKRLMVNLVCKRASQISTTQAINVVFLILGHLFRTCLNKRSKPFSLLTLIFQTV